MNRQFWQILLAAFTALFCLFGCAQQSGLVGGRAIKGELIYQNPLSSWTDVSDWVMEGEGEVSFDNGWMQMWSPDEASHHVFWMPKKLPQSFIAEWDAQALKTDAGLVIVFFAAKGVNGEGIFDPSLPPRNGTFSQYTEGQLGSYHISYYANAAHNPDRGHANLRKNNTFSLLQTGEVGISTFDRTVQRVRLEKISNHIKLFINDRKVIDYTDDNPVVEGINTGKPLGDGYLGFRQMQWTRFQYRDLAIWEVAGE